ncbi:MAG: DUF2029 domain-containing protein [Alphaproteobacteria bacterium]|nr:DUF2029 domain-containing protein [Alphaproteobacteria bacterium]
MRKALPLLLLVAAVLYGLFSVRPAWDAVTSVKHARDYATYHYAAVEAVNPGNDERGDPYDTAALGRRARKEGTRKTVHPYFYPPPFLLSMLWVAPPGLEPLSLSTGYRAWFWINQACLLGVLVAMWRWFRAHPLLLAAIALTFSPIPDNMKMGQANLPVLLVAVLGLWRTRGTLVGIAGMAKMSPALYLVAWVAQGRFVPVALAAATAVGLSLLALPLVPLDTQIEFYTQILPGFSTGHYHGLTVPISLPANHSIPDLFNQLWPGPDDHSLDPRAQTAAKAVSLVLLGGLAALSRRAHLRGDGDALGQANLFGAFTALLLITPVYTYEHHLVMMLLPVAASLQAVLSRRLPWATLVVLAPAYGALAWTLAMLRGTQKALPELAWWLQESKFIGVVAIGVVCAVAAFRTPRGEGATAR